MEGFFNEFTPLNKNLPANVKNLLAAIGAILGYKVEKMRELFGLKNKGIVYDTRYRYLKGNLPVVKGLKKRGRPEKFAENEKSLISEYIQNFPKNRVFKVRDLIEFIFQKTGKRWGYTVIYYHLTKLVKFVRKNNDFGATKRNWISIVDYRLIVATEILNT